MIKKLHDILLFKSPSLSLLHPSQCDIHKRAQHSFYLYGVTSLRFPTSGISTLYQLDQV